MTIVAALPSGVSVERRPSYRLVSVSKISGVTAIFLSTDFSRFGKLQKFQSF
jgi:hypothetical protein